MALDPDLEWVLVCALLLVVGPTGLWETMEEGREKFKAEEDSRLLLGGG